MSDPAHFEAGKRREIRLALVVVGLVALAAVAACVAIGIAVAPYAPPGSVLVLALVPVVLAPVVFILLRY